MHRYRAEQWRMSGRGPDAATLLFIPPRLFSEGRRKQPQLFAAFTLTQLIVTHTCTKVPFNNEKTMKKAGWVKSRVSKATTTFPFRPGYRGQKQTEDN